MGKSSEKKLVGQPIFNQILKIIPREVINRVVMVAKSDRYYKSFSTWDELVSLLTSTKHFLTFCIYQIIRL